MEKEEDTEKLFSVGEETSSGFTIENTLNKDDDTLPFGYFEPSTEGKLTWTCGEGPPKKKGLPDIVSVFQMDMGNRKERKESFLKDIEEAISCRDELVKEGWKKTIPPKIEFTMSGSDKPLNRKQKRYLEKKVKNFAPKDY